MSQHDMTLALPLVFSLSACTETGTELPIDADGTETGEPAIDESSDVGDDAQTPDGDQTPDDGADDPFIMQLDHVDLYAENNWIEIRIYDATDITIGTIVVTGQDANRILGLLLSAILGFVALTLALSK